MNFGAFGEFGEKEAAMPETSSIRPSVSTEHRLVADRQTDKQTNRQIDQGRI